MNFRCATRHTEDSSAVALEFEMTLLFAEFTLHSCLGSLQDKHFPFSIQ